MQLGETQRDFYADAIKRYIRKGVVRRASFDAPLTFYSVNPNFEFRFFLAFVWENIPLPVLVLSAGLSQVSDHAAVDRSNLSSEENRSFRTSLARLAMDQ